MKIVYSKGLNLLSAEPAAIVYPETGKTIHEIIKFVEDNINDNSIVVTLSETVVKQLWRMVKEKKLNKENLIFESNLLEYKEYEFPAAVFLETYSNYTKHLFRC
jgi:hypothetical protein